MNRGRDRKASKDYRTGKRGARLDSTRIVPSSSEKVTIKSTVQQLPYDEKARVKYAKRPFDVGEQSVIIKLSNKVLFTFTCTSAQSSTSKLDKLDKLPQVIVLAFRRRQRNEPKGAVYFT